METADDKRMIWNKVFKMAACDTCGRYFAPVETTGIHQPDAEVPLSQAFHLRQLPIIDFFVFLQDRLLTSERSCFI